MAMTWRATGLEDIARHVIGCQLNSRTEDSKRLCVDDVLGNVNVCQAVPDVKRVGQRPVHQPPSHKGPSDNARHVM